MSTSQIMLVEDERIVAMHLRQQLLKLGYAVPAVVASGAKALRQIETARPDVILMDINIEGDMDGISTAAAIPSDYHIPVIYLTAYSEEATLARARSTRPYGYLIKPFSERELHATIQMTLERRAVEIELRAANQALETVVEERTSALVQRDLLIREVYHRVKNNLQMVNGLLYIQARAIEDPQAQQALFDMRGRIVAMGLVHQQLMGSPDLKTFDVAPFLNELAENILHSIGTTGVELAVEACTMSVGLDFAIPLGLLVAELVTNSFKHAFPEGMGSVTVTLRRHPEQEQELVLIVADDGVGLSNSDGQGGGVGIRIVANLVRQLEGNMTIRNGNGLATEVRLTVPTPS